MVAYDLDLYSFLAFLLVSPRRARELRGWNYLDE